MEKSKWNAKGRNTIFSLAKKTSGPFWPRLTKDTKKDPNIKARIYDYGNRRTGTSG